MGGKVKFALVKVVSQRLLLCLCGLATAVAAPLHGRPAKTSSCEATHPSIHPSSTILTTSQEAKKQQLAMAKNRHLVCLLFLLTAAAAAAAATVSAAAAGNLTAYEMLERYMFPRGILPQGVQRYMLRPDGSFEVFFPGSGGCEFRVGGRYLLRYERRIAGTACAGPSAACGASA